MVSPNPTPLTAGLEALAFLGVMTGPIIVVASWSYLPPEVPGHYDLAGNVTRYDPKGALWLLVGVNVGLYGLLGAVNVFPQLWNLPGSPANRPRQLKLAQTVIRLLKAFVAWLFTALLWGSVRVAQGAATGLPGWFLPVVLGSVFSIVGGWLYLANRLEVRSGE